MQKAAIIVQLIQIYRLLIQVILCVVFINVTEGASPGKKIWNPNTRIIETRLMQNTSYVGKVAYFLR